MANWRAHRCSMCVMILPLQNRRGSFASCAAHCLAPQSKKPLFEVLWNVWNESWWCVLNVRLDYGCEVTAAGDRSQLTVRSSQRTIFRSTLAWMESTWASHDNLLSTVTQAIGFSSQPWSCDHNKWWVMVDQYVYMTVVRLPFRRSCQCSRADPVTGIQLESGAREETGRFRDVKRCVATGDWTRVSGISLLHHTR